MQTPFEAWTKAVLTHPTPCVWWGQLLCCVLHTPTLPLNKEPLLATLGLMDITIDRSGENRLLQELENRTDFEALRIKRYLSMPDLSRTPGSPLAEIVKRVKDVPELAGFDVIEIPEIVPADISFDLFDFPADHPARSHSDTYYVDDTNILRTGVGAGV